MVALVLAVLVVALLMAALAGTVACYTTKYIQHSVVCACVIGIVAAEDAEAVRKMIRKVC